MTIDNVPIPLSHDVAEKQTLEPGRLSALLMRHGSMELRWYAPKVERHADP
jgi:hypothetical protein